MIWRENLDFRSAFSFHFLKVWESKYISASTLSVSKVLYISLSTLILGASCWAYSSFAFRKTRDFVFRAILISSLAIFCGFPNCSLLTASIAVKTQISGCATFRIKSISQGLSIQYSRMMASYLFLPNSDINRALEQTFSIFKTEGSRLVISNTLNESQNSPLKFFGEVEIFLFGKNFSKVWKIIIRHDVFPTLQLIQTTIGLWREM